MFSKKLFQLPKVKQFLHRYPTTLADEESRSVSKSGEVEGGVDLGWNAEKTFYAPCPLNFYKFKEIPFLKSFPLIFNLY